MSDPLDVPRPLGPGPSDFADRVRALRSDARVGAAVLACVAVAAGVAWFRAGIAPSASATAPTDVPAGTRSASRPAPSPTAPLAASTTTTTAALAAIVVDVVGAVRAPGVVSLSANARVLDAIRAAGGATAGADLSRLNLASKLSDGARIAVPRVGAAPPAVDPSAVSGGLGAQVDPSSGGLAPTASGAGAPIDVNTATVDQLEALPGIGPTLAAAIVQGRERYGPFRSVDELTRVPGIGDGRLSQLRDLVTV